MIRELQENEVTFYLTKEILQRRDKHDPEAIMIWGVRWECFKSEGGMWGPCDCEDTQDSYLATLTPEGIAAAHEYMLRGLNFMLKDYAATLEVLNVDTARSN